MPEIAEVARIVHFLRKHLVGKTVAKITAPEDANVFGKVGTSGPAIEKALKGRKVTSARSQGKYFWITLDKPPHLLMHFGMTGWIHIRGDQTAYTNYYKKLKPEELEAWPPKFWKFHLETDSDPKVRVAFTDPRRFGRVRLIDCPGDEIRKHSPLVENGPDPVNDLDRFTEDYLASKMKKKHVPIKALILDQAIISGLGNWVGDEVMYNARMHPEQYCDTFSDEEISQLYKSIRYVCQTAVDLNADSDKFPDKWLFNHRWGKGTKGESTRLPNGEKLAFLTVGGRTSCYAPNLQKKTGRVPSGIKEEPLDDKAEEKPAEKKKKLNKFKTGTQGKVKVETESKKVEGDDTEHKSSRRKRKATKQETDDEAAAADVVAEEKKSAKSKRTKINAAAVDRPIGTKPRAAATVQSTPKDIKEKSKVNGHLPGDSGRRRSGRLARA